MKICCFFTNDRNVCACLDTSVVALRAPPRQAHTNQPNELNPKRREIGRHADPLVPARFSPVALFSDLHIFVYDIFFACAIVSGEALPISSPSCHILKPRAISKRISLLVSSLILHITSSPFISLSMKRYKPLE